MLGLYSSYTEKEILQLVSQGDEQAFNELVRQYHSKVYFHALAFTKIAPDAEEITQDIFIKIWEQREKLTIIEDFKNFLFIMGRNRIISVMRKRTLDTVLPSEQEKEDVLLPDKQYELKEINAIILKGIDQLTQQQKLVFKMSRLENKSHDKIAEALGISKHAVNWHMVKALNFLRHYIHKYGDMMIFLIGNIFYHTYYITFHPASLYVHA